MFESNVGFFRGVLSGVLYASSFLRLIGKSVIVEVDEDVVVAVGVLKMCCGIDSIIDSAKIGALLSCGMFTFVDATILSFGP